MNTIELNKESATQQGTMPFKGANQIALCAGSPEQAVLFLSSLSGQ